MTEQECLATKLLLVEANPSGHRLMYVGRFLEEAHADGLDVEFLTTRPTLESVQGREFIGGHLRTAINIRCSDLPLDPCRRSLRVLRANIVDRVPVLLDGDRWLPLLALFWPPQRRMVILLMRTWHGRVPRRPSEVLKFLCVLYLRLFTRVELRRLVGPFEKDVATPLSMPIVNDPLPRAQRITRGTARGALGINSNRRVLLIAGGIDHRKSVKQVVDWLEGDPRASQLILLLAGCCSPDMRAEMAGPTAQQLIARGSLVCVDRFLNDNELASCLIAADVVLVLHENQGPSGVLAHAAVFGKPIVAWGSRSVVNTTIDNGLGVIAQSREWDHLWSAVSQAIVMPPPMVEKPTTSEFAAQVLGHLKGKWIPGPA
jgi:glycosyltransferase involved in cell wall biosynthesis